MSASITLMDQNFNANDVDIKVFAPCVLFFPHNGICTLLGGIRHMVPKIYQPRLGSGTIPGTLGRSGCFTPECATQIPDVGVLVSRGNQRKGPVTQNSICGNVGQNEFAVVDVVKLSAESTVVD